MALMLIRPTKSRNLSSGFDTQQRRGAGVTAQQLICFTLPRNAPVGDYD
jgi:hypothetical protein